MRKYQKLPFFSLLFIVALLGLLSCETKNLDIQPDKSKMARISAVDANSSAPLSYSFVAYVNGQLRRRNDQTIVRAGDHIFVELRAFIQPNTDKTTNAVYPTVWTYSKEDFKLVRIWSPSDNNAYEFEVIAPMIRIPGDARNISNITIYHQSLDCCTSRAEREPVRLTFLQVYGGIEPDLPFFQ